MKLVVDVICREEFSPAFSIKHLSPTKPSKDARLASITSIYFNFFLHTIFSCNGLSTPKSGKQVSYCHKTNLDSRSQAWATYVKLEVARMKAIILQRSSTIDISENCFSHIPCVCPTNDGSFLMLIENKNFAPEFPGN